MCGVERTFHLTHRGEGNLAVELALATVTAEEKRRDINERDDIALWLNILSYPRNSEDRRVERLSGMAPNPVLTEHLAVVGSEDHLCVVVNDIPQLLKLRINLLDLVLVEFTDIVRAVRSLRCDGVSGDRLCLSTEVIRVLRVLRMMRLHQMQDGTPVLLVLLPVSELLDDTLGCSERLPSTRDSLLPETPCLCKHFVDGPLWDPFGEPVLDALVSA